MRSRLTVPSPAAYPWRRGNRQTTSSRLTGACLVWLLTACLSLALTPEAWAQHAERRIVAVGDIHGALEPFRDILRQAALIDSQDRWIGGGDTLVQTGDFLDRGAEARGVAELLQSLQQQAPKQGGQVIVLLGNHEALNLVMDLRDVTPEIAERFERKRSEKRRQSHCRRLLTRRQDRTDRPQVDGDQFLAGCRKDVPVGLLEYVEALEPKGDLGKWIRQLPIVAQVDGWLFMHAGLSPSYGERPWQELNRQALEELESFDRLRTGLLYRELITPTTQLKEILGVARALHMVMTERGTPIRTPTMEDMAAAARLNQWVLFDSEGPIWFRGYSSWSEAEGAEKIAPILEAQKARGLVVGHTPQSSRSIDGRFGNRVFLIDTGMLNEVYKGRPSALEIVGDQVQAIYADGRVPLVATGATPEPVPTAAGGANPR